MTFLIWFIEMIGKLLNYLQNFITAFKFYLNSKKTNLLSKTIILNQDEEALKKLSEIYELLDKDKNFKPQLKYIRHTNIKIRVDESPDYDDAPKNAQYLNKYSEKQIIINVKDFLKADKHYLCRQFTQKFCIFADYQHFGNLGRPYLPQSEDETIFTNISNKLKEKVTR